MLPLPESILNRLLLTYPKGSRVRLIKEMKDDPRPVPVGTLGTVRQIDSIGTIFVNWDNGQSLGVVYGVDEIKKI